jgi:hypothetical protein
MQIQLEQLVVVYYLLNSIGSFKFMTYSKLLMKLHLGVRKFIYGWFK